MHILCPHCRNPIEVVTLVPHQEITCPACGSSFHLETDSTTTHQSAAGQKLGKFELMDTVGQGAFGTVYKARDLELDRVVAVKVPRAGNLVGPRELDRFLREARSAAQLRHPSIVSVHEVGQLDGVPYLVSDFVQGITLAELLSARRPGFRPTAELIAAVAEALQYAHGQGVVHRDVKPSNIMLDEKGEPHLMDFGLAKRDAGEITMTIEGQVLGTPAYMSPEQARGQAHAVDGRSDVYSLGVVLYQLLTGELPFRGTQRMLLHQALHDDPRPPRALNDRIPRDLETICLKAMAKEPAQRYPTAGEWAADLRRWLRGEPIQARPVGRWEGAVRWARRRPAMAALLAVSGVALLALVGLVVGLVYNAELNEAYRLEAKARSEAEVARQAEESQRKRAEMALGVAETARKAEAKQRGRAETALGMAEKARKAEAEQRGRAEDALARADLIGYFHSIFLAEVALKEGHVALAQQRLKECKRELRNWEWRYLDAQCRSELLSFAGDRPVFSPDGARIAARGNDGVVRVYNARTGERALVLKGPAVLRVPVFSPDSARIAARGKDGVVRVYDARAGQEAIALKGPALLGDPVFSPDGARIAARYDGGVLVWTAPADVGAWQAQRRKALADGLLAWHQDQADDFTRTGQWFAAAFHLGRLVASGPPVARHHLRRGQALASLGKTAQARQDFEKALSLPEGLSVPERIMAHAELGQWGVAGKLSTRAVEAPGASPDTWALHALLRLHQRDQAGYPTACAALVKHFGKDQEAAVANTVSRTCALGPGALPDLKPAVALARYAVKWGPENANYRSTLGAILYRAGQAKEAVAELNESIRLSDQGGTWADFLFLAMAHKRLGDAREAEKWLGRAVQALDKGPPPEQRLEAQLLRREAEQLVRPGRKKRDHPGKGPGEERR
jgi:tRNA A-37 threonylcarbamoyl transferase component Bud32/tetratricopeptide (TPR) repeat protein